jgi:hypothetical protein
MDSDDSQIRLQIRCEALGEGAAKAIEDTDIRVHPTVDGKRLGLSVWHATQGFTPTAQPCLVNMRLQVPLFGAYRLQARADHGCVGVRRLILANSKLEGRVGYKVKGIRGYIGGHDLDNVVLSGDLEVYAESASISGMLRAISSCKVSARTGTGDIRLSFTPDPQTGLDVTGVTDKGTLNIGIMEGEQRERATRQLQSEQQIRSKGYEGKAIRIDAKVTSSSGNVTVVSSM